MEQLKKIALWWWLVISIYLVLVFSPKAKGQDSAVLHDSLGAAYFVVVSQTKPPHRVDSLYAGDRVYIKSSNLKGANYNIVEITENSFVVADENGNREVHPASETIAIKKVKPNPGIVLGTVGLVAGIAVLGPVMSGSTDLDNIAPLFLLGTGLIAGGIAGLVPPQPYRIKKAVMRIYEVPMEKMARSSDGLPGAR